MLKQEEMEAVAADAVEVLRAGEVPFCRGRPFDYALKLARLNAALTLPTVRPQHAIVAISLKVLYALWNVVVDDEIDRAGTTRGIDASLLFLSGEEADVTQFRMGASALLVRIAALIPGGQIRRSEALGFDLLEVIQGLNYERFINSHPELAAPFEYRRYSTMTASLKVLLDIDCLFAEPAPDRQTYAVLREAYDELTCAIKLASDIGTLRREVHEEDNMNLLRILAAPMLPASEGRHGAEKTMAAAVQFRDQVAGEATAHMRRAEQLLGEIPGADTGSLLPTVERVVRVYASGVDPFFA